MLHRHLKRMSLVLVLVSGCHKDLSQSKDALSFLAGIGAWIRINAPIPTFATQSQAQVTWDVHLDYEPASDQQPSPTLNLDRSYIDASNQYHFERFELILNPTSDNDPATIKQFYHSNSVSDLSGTVSAMNGIPKTAYVIDSTGYTIKSADSTVTAPTDLASSLTEFASILQSVKDNQVSAVADAVTNIEVSLASFNVQTATTGDDRSLLATTTPRSTDSFKKILSDAYVPNTSWPNSSKFLSLGDQDSHFIFVSNDPSSPALSYVGTSVISFDTQANETYTNENESDYFELALARDGTITLSHYHAMGSDKQALASYVLEDASGAYQVLSNDDLAKVSSMFDNIQSYYPEAFFSELKGSGASGARDLDALKPMVDRVKNYMDHFLQASSTQLLGDIVASQSVRASGAAGADSGSDRSGQRAPTVATPSRSGTGTASAGGSGTSGESGGGTDDRSGSTLPVLR